MLQYTEWNKNHSQCGEYVKLNLCNEYLKRHKKERTQSYKDISAIHYKPWTQNTEFVIHHVSQCGLASFKALIHDL